MWFCAPQNVLKRVDLMLRSKKKQQKKNPNKKNKKQNQRDKNNRQHRNYGRVCMLSINCGNGITGVVYI